MRKIKVLIVDDHMLVWSGISAVIALQKDMEVISEAVNGQNAVDKVMRFSPRVALVDIFMPVMSGIEAIKTIRESSDLIRGIGYVSQSKYFSSEFAELVVN